VNERLRMLNRLQWVGLIAGAVVFATAHLTGFWLTQAKCGQPGPERDLQFDAAIIALTAVGCLAILGSAAAAAIVFRSTRGAEPGDGPVEGRERPLEPFGRLQFFSAAALAANVIFFMIVLLNGIGAVFNVACRTA